MMKVRSVAALFMLGSTWLLGAQTLIVENDVPLSLKVYYKTWGGHHGSAHKRAVTLKEHGKAELGDIKATRISNVSVVRPWRKFLRSVPTVDMAVLAESLNAVERQHNGGVRLRFSLDVSSNKITTSVEGIHGTAHVAKFVKPQK